MSIFSEILIIIKFGEKLRNIYNVQPLDCPNPRLASWTNFNARRLRMSKAKLRKKYLTAFSQNWSKTLELSCLKSIPCNRFSLGASGPHLIILGLLLKIPLI
jgi:hypothetical protein